MKIKFKINWNLPQMVRESIFPLINAACLLCLLLPSLKLGIISAVLILVAVILNKRSFSLLFADKWFFLYLIVNIVSFISYIWNGRPIAIFFSALSYNFIPSLLYLVGASQALDKSPYEASFKVFNTCLFIMIFGLIFYLFFPDFYYSHIGQGLDTHAWGTADYRFGSYIDSLNLASMCTACIPMTFFAVTSKNKIKKVISLFLIVICLVLAMQRSAWVVSAACLMGIFFLSDVEHSRKIAGLAGVFIVILAVVVFKDRIFTAEQLTFFEKRLSSLNLQSMVGERLTQWKNAWEIFINNPWGYGLGSLGHKAHPYGLSVINDGNYLRILAETGVLGFVSFIMIIINSVKNVLKNKMIYIAFVIGGFCLQAIGSNVFDLFYSSFIFWYFLGYGSRCRGDNNTI